MPYKPALVRALANLKITKFLELSLYPTTLENKTLSTISIEDLETRIKSGLEPFGIADAEVTGEVSFTETGTLGTRVKEFHNDVVITFSARIDRQTIIPVRMRLGFSLSCFEEDDRVELLGPQFAKLAGVRRGPLVAYTPYETFQNAFLALDMSLNLSKTAGSLGLAFDGISYDVALADMQNAIFLYSPAKQVIGVGNFSDFTPNEI